MFSSRLCDCLNRDKKGKGKLLALSLASGRETRRRQGRTKRGEEGKRKKIASFAPHQMVDRHPKRERREKGERKKSPLLPVPIQSLGNRIGKGERKGHILPLYSPHHRLGG